MIHFLEVLRDAERLILASVAFGAMVAVVIAPILQLSGEGQHRVWRALGAGCAAALVMCLALIVFVQSSQGTQRVIDRHQSTSIVQR